MFEGLSRVTTLPAIFICSAWIWTSKGMVEGAIFGLSAIIAYVAVILISAEMAKEKLKVEQGRM